VTDKVKGYSRTQVTLHWIVVVLVAFQFVAHDGIEDAWRSLVRGQSGADADTAPLAYMHIAAGSLILVLALARIYLRFTRGTPPPPPNEPRLMHITAEAVHGSIYVLLLLLPISGLVAWLFVVEAGGDAHELMQNLLLLAIALHIGGALFQHFVRRSDVLMRMLSPEQSP